MDAPSIQSPRKLSVAKRLLFASVPLLTLLVLIELVARCVVTEASIAKRFEQIEQIIVHLGNEPGESIFQSDPDCFWRLKPNVVAPEERGNWWGGMMSNSHGMRSREVSVEEARDKLRILCFGDSTTFAFGVDFADAWPNQLQTLLDSDLTTTGADSSAQAVEVLNAGIPGQTSYQGRKRLKAELEKWHPQFTIITFGNNDGWRWDDLADKDHGSSSFPLIGSWINHSRALFWLRSWRLPSAAQQTINNESRWAEQATLNYFDPNMQWTPRVSLDDFADNLRAMIAMCHEHNSEAILVVWPDQRQLLDQSTWRLPYQEVTRQVAAETKVGCIDLVPLFERSGRRAIERFLPRDVIHVDREGNHWVAKQVSARVCQ